MQPFKPTTTDKDSGEFFAAAAQQRLVVKSCRSCSRAIHPPTAHCPMCGSWDTTWREATGRGRLYSWTTVTHQVHSAYPTPYTIVIVELDDEPGVRLVGRLPGQPSLQAGMPMSLWFEPAGEGVVLPNWRPT